MIKKFAFTKIVEEILSSLDYLVDVQNTNMHLPCKEMEKEIVFIGFRNLKLNYLQNLVGGIGIVYLTETVILIMKYLSFYFHFYVWLSNPDLDPNVIPGFDQSLIQPKYQD